MTAGLQQLCCIFSCIVIQSHLIHVCVHAARGTVPFLPPVCHFCLIARLLCYFLVKSTDGGIFLSGSLPVERKGALFDRNVNMKV